MEWVLGAGALGTLTVAVLWLWERSQRKEQETYVLHLEGQLQTHQLLVRGLEKAQELSQKKLQEYREKLAQTDPSAVLDEFFGLRPKVPDDN